MFTLTGAGNCKHTEKYSVINLNYCPFRHIILLIYMHHDHFDQMHSNPIALKFFIRICSREFKREGFDFQYIFVLVIMCCYTPVSQQVSLCVSAGCFCLMKCEVWWSVTKHLLWCLTEICSQSCRSPMTHSVSPPAAHKSERD